MLVLLRLVIYCLMDLKNSPKSLLKGLSKVLLDSSKVLEEAHQSYSATDDLESIDDENGEADIVVQLSYKFSSMHKIISSIIIVYATSS